MAKRKNRPRKMGLVMTTNNDRVEITRHLHEQYNKRTKSKLSMEQLKKKVTNQIHHGRLITIRGNEEVHEHRGIKYVCKRESDRYGQKLVVVTMKLTSSRQRTGFSSDLSLEKVDFRAIGLPAS